MVNHLTSAFGVNGHLDFTDRSTWHLALPLFHVAGIGILVRCLLAGGTLSLTQHGATHSSMVATQLCRALADTAAVPEKILLGGGPLPPDKMKQAQSRGFNLFPSYGMTEMSSTITCATQNDFSTLGQVLPGRELKIASDGEILVRGDALFQGYETPDGLQTCRDSDGWFSTGDVGALAEGKLVVHGRKDRMFISGGENIQPEEIEKVIRSVPGVLSAQVYPVEDPEFGHRPAATLQCTASFQQADMQAALDKELPRFKHPAHFKS